VCYIKIGQAILLCRPAEQAKVVTNSTRALEQKHPLVDKLTNLRSRPACQNKYTQLTTLK